MHNAIAFRSETNCRTRPPDTSQILGSLPVHGEEGVILGQHPIHCPLGAAEIPS